MINTREMEKRTKIITESWKTVYLRMNKVKTEKIVDCFIPVIIIYTFRLLLALKLETS